jgi:hypothetical protein
MKHFTLRYETQHGMAEALEKWNKVCGQTA